MPGEALLIGIATIAVAVAGFTAVTSTLRPPGGAWSAPMRIRQRAIVSTSFNVVFEALAPLILFAATNDEHTAMRFASAGVAVYATGIVTWRTRQFMRARAQMTGSMLVLLTLGPAATVLFWLNALVVASLAVFATALCLQLSVAVVSFYSLVSAAQE
ncbi:MAG TPA: hypothetical protein VF484_10540 [Candidatus Limnocylindrales bacterium]